MKVPEEEYLELDEQEVKEWKRKSKEENLKAWITGSPSSSLERDTRVPEEEYLDLQEQEVKEWKRKSREENLKSWITGSPSPSLEKEGKQE